MARNCMALRLMSRKSFSSAFHDTFPAALRYHVISATFAGCSFTVISCTLPLRIRIRRLPSGAMLALCVMMTTVVL